MYIKYRVLGIINPYTKHCGGNKVGKKRVEYEEFDLIEDNLKDYKKKRPKPLIIIINIVLTLLSIHSLARIYPLHVEAIIPGIVVPGVYLNQGFEGLNIGVPQEGSLLIDGVEVDLDKLKEEYGILYTIIVPMSKQEARRQYNKLKNFTYNLDYSITPMFGYTIELNEEETLEYWMLVSSTNEKIKEMNAPINREFVGLVQELIECRINPNINVEQCFLGYVVRNFDQYPHISEDLLKRYSFEIDLKLKLIEFEIYKAYVESKGYNLEEHLPDPNVWKKTKRT
jgi:hypothetical protein